MELAFPEKVRARQANYNKYRKAHPERIFAAKLKSVFGMTVEEHERLKLKQGNRCAICDDPPKLPKKMLDIDHDHKTGTVRGLLCPRCNKALGTMEDSTELLGKAIIYLDEHNQNKNQ